MSDAEDIVQGAVAQKLEKQRGKVENTEVLLSRLDLRPAYRRGIAASRRTRGPSLSNPFTEILASEARYRSAPTVEDQLIRQEERQRVRCALESLTDNERRLLEPYLREDGDAHDLKFHTTGVTDQEVDSLRKQAAQAFRAAYLTLINLPNRLPPVPREPVQDKTKILRLAA
jgi:DNA-directed RNA polymerase specialized sigma24 family protein